MPPRDSQRSKVYAAETAVPLELRKRGESFTTVEEMQAYADKLIGSAWFKRRWPKLRGVRIRPGKGCRRAICHSGFHPIIQMPLWSRTEFVLLHEIAHACSYARYQNRVAGHGPEWVSIFLELLRHQMGDEIWRAQKQAFIEGKVKTTTRKKRNLTPAQRKQAIANLEKARAAKRSA